MIRIWKRIPWLLTIIPIQFIDFLGSTTGQGALYADGNGYHQYGYGLYNIRIDGRLQAALQDVGEKLVRVRARTHFPSKTYHNCKEYADDGHANYGGPVGYTNHSRQCHTGRIDGYAQITDLPNNIRGRGEAAYGATLESETI